MKNCFTCKHERVPLLGEPCASCVAWDKYEEEEKTLPTAEPQEWTMTFENVTVDGDTIKTITGTPVIKEDVINHPHHYADTCSLECIDVMRVVFGNEAEANFCHCNAFKYMWRYKNKNGQEDLKKAQWYLNKAYNLIGASDTHERLFDLLQELDEE